MPMTLQSTAGNVSSDPAPDANVNSPHVQASALSTAEEALPQEFEVRAKSENEAICFAEVDDITNSRRPGRFEIVYADGATNIEVWSIDIGDAGFTRFAGGLTWRDGIGSRFAPAASAESTFGSPDWALLTAVDKALYDFRGRDAVVAAALQERHEALRAEIDAAKAAEIEAGVKPEETESERVIAAALGDAPSEPTPVEPTVKKTTTKSPDDHLLRQIAEAELHVAACESEWNSLKEQAKEAKESFESALSHLRALSRAVRNDDARPLLKAAEAVEVKLEVDPTTANTAEPEPSTVESSSPDSQPTPQPNWRDFRFDALGIATGLPPGIIKSLAAAGIETVGQLSDHQAKHGEFWAKEIKGIGSGKAEKLSDVMIQFWAAHPEAVSQEK